MEIDLQTDDKWFNLKYWEDDDGPAKARSDGDADTDATTDYNRGCKQFSSISFCWNAEILN